MKLTLKLILMMVVGPSSLHADDTNSSMSWIQQLWVGARAIRPSFSGFTPTDPQIAYLPLIENIPQELSGDSFVVLYTGDGGWAGIDSDIAESFGKHGVPVIGLNSLRYFWKKKNPDQAAEDLTKVISFYRNKLKMNSVIVVGFSFGADVISFIVNQLDAETKKSVRTVALLSPAEKANFEFHFVDWLNLNPNGSLILPEIANLPKEISVKCLYGKDDNDSICIKLDKSKYQVTDLPGGHHFGGDSDLICDAILK